MRRADPRRLPVVLVVVVTMTCATAGAVLAAEPSRIADLSQAELMLAFLERARRGTIEEELLGELLASAGTEQVIAQMNIMRRVSKEQYAQILRSLLDDEPPLVEPLDESDRAARGVTGLVEIVWPVLRWGVAHTGLLRQRLEEVGRLDVYEIARRRALDYLPPAAEIAPRVSIVMGGKAGAAALAGDRIYVDLLLLSYLDDAGRRPYVLETDLNDFIAHEMHHLGLERLLSARRDSLALDSSGALAYELLSLLVAEGSATYLVSGHRDLERALNSDGAMNLIADRGPEILAACERVLGGLVAGEITSREQYEAATGFLLGSSPHLAGTLMLHRIDRHDGLDAVIAVLVDPRRLPAAYNAAVTAAEGGADPRPFAADLARALAILGEPEAEAPIGSG